MYSINVENLTKTYGKRNILDNISFSVEGGEIVGLLGPNGAGKTTTMRIIGCLLPKTGGKVTVNGFDTESESGSMEIRRKLSIVHDNVGLYESLTARENLEFFGKLFGMKSEAITESVKHYAELLDINDRLDDRISNYSKGMKQKIAVIRALMHRPEILMLDEPMANLDPETAKSIRDLLLEAKKEGKAILLSTHNLDEANRICDKIVILKSKILISDTPANLRARFSENIVKVSVDRIDEKLKSKLSLLANVTIDESTKCITFSQDKNLTIDDMMGIVKEDGEKILSVDNESNSLEEAYLKLVGEKQ